MRTVPLLLVALLAGASLSAATADACGPLMAMRTAASAGTVRWTWGSPEALTANQDFTGPGVYTQTISVTGLAGTLNGLTLQADVRGDYPAAWAMLFFPPFSDCQGHPALSAVPTVAGAEVIPGATVSVMSEMPVCWPPALFVLVTVLFDPPFTFDPAKRYGLATLSFDHSASVTGAGDATHCGGADVGLCFKLGSSEGMPEQPALTWQGGGAECAGLTPSRRTTWGTVKQIYR